MSLRKGYVAAKKYVLSKDNGFLTRLSVTKGKSFREPSVDPAFERADPVDSFGSQQQRHTGAW